MTLTLSLLDALALHFNTNARSLQELLNHPTMVNKVDAFMKGKSLQTTYIDRNGERKEVKYARLSCKSASAQHAYEGYLGGKYFVQCMNCTLLLLLVTVRQHFYCRHRIRLMHPYLKCVVEEHPKGHYKYYPLELLEIVYENDTNRFVDEACWSADIYETATTATPTSLTTSVSTQTADHSVSKNEEETECMKEIINKIYLASFE